jgi:adenylate cyclase
VCAAIRKLAAILAADIAGYGKLVGADEEGTLEELRTLHREFLDPEIERHHGRVVKRTGDGILVEFASVVDGVRCAIAVQQGIAQRNASIPPGRRIEFRIGIHLGDVVIEDDGDLMGDGVNIAARLEGIADPGGISVSEDAWRHARGKITVEFLDLGDRQLKHVAFPVRVYSASPLALRASAAPMGLPSAYPPLPDKPSIAVLPFLNLGGQDREYLAEAITEDIITALSRWHWFFVISRNSSFAYKGRAVDVKQIGRELGIRYVLEGSVRQNGARLRVTGQLIDVATAAHIWADSFDRELTDIFALQDEITEQVVNAIEPAMLQSEGIRIIRKNLKDLNAFSSFQRGMALQQNVAE